MAAIRPTAAHVPAAGPELPFARMHGCGNDFVVIDDRDGFWRPRRSELARALCDRRKGLGGDGIILIGRDPAVDFAMTYTNGTGVDGEMCGNGARCVVRRAHDLGIAGDRTMFRTDAGMIGADVTPATITLDMTKPSPARLNLSVASGGRDWLVHEIDTGVPHIVIFVSGIEAIDVAADGPPLRHHPQFPRGVNVNFGEKLGPNRYRVRTYERGVEAETLACGTGSVATALIAHLLEGASSPVTIVPSGGGELRIDFTPKAFSSGVGTGSREENATKQRPDADGGFDHVRLAGPAETIATGTLTAGWLQARGLI